MPPCLQSYTALYAVCAYNGGSISPFVYLCSHQPAYCTTQQCIDGIL